MSYIGNTSTTQSFTPAIDYFSGNASTTAFTLSRPVASVAQVQVTIDNVAQNPSSAYTVSNNTITFTSAPLSGTNNIYVYYTSPITQVIAPGQGTVTATSMASSTGTGAGVFQTSPTITTPTISSLSSASATALTLQSAGTTAITVDASQNVGIGTSSPTNYANQRTLAVNGTTYGRIDLMAGGTVYGSLYGGTSGPTLSTGSALPVMFETNSSERMRITSDGYLKASNNGSYVGVSDNGHELRGTTTNVILRVNANNASYTSPVLSIECTRNTSNNTYYFIQATRVGQADVFRVADSGNCTNTNGSYGTISDVKLKENIVDATPKLDKVNQLQVRNYNFIGDDLKQIGFVAQEFEQVFPSMVEESSDKDKDGNDLGTTTKTIKTTVLIPVLVKAIQELKAINDTQAETLSQQTETIDALTARIVALENR